MLGQAIRQKTDFYIAKATEGKTYKDECLELWANLMPGRLKGWYHYARPENNSPDKEAEHFMKTLGDKIGTGIMALDWEGEALHYDTEWAADWAQYVYIQTGIKPLIYVQESEVKNMGALLDLTAACGLQNGVMGQKRLPQGNGRTMHYGSTAPLRWIWTYSTGTQDSG